MTQSAGNVHIYGNTGDAMKKNAQNAAWVPVVEKSDGPMYLTIAEAIARDIRNHVLQPGQRLPPQRVLAEGLDIDYTTVSRAYAAAGKQGLVEGRVGQGTYVSDAKARKPSKFVPQFDRSVDMGMNMPPRFEDAVLTQRMWAGFDAMRDEQGLELLLRYQIPGGNEVDRAAAKGWLIDKFDLDHTDGVALCSGVQGALLSILSLLTKPGDTVCCEALTYPGFMAVAKDMGLKVVPVAMDEGGVDPKSLADVCKAEQPKLFYTIPTLHNPTTVTLSEERRLAVVEIARANSLTIVEDDAYGVLADAPPPPIAKIAPELTWYISTLSKCLAPSLRVTYVVPPQNTPADQLRRAIRANGSMVSPLTAALATKWITSGLAQEIVTAIRLETQVRQQAMSIWLPNIPLKKGAFHIWLPLPDALPASEFFLSLRGLEIGLVPGVAFAPLEAPNAVRIALGAATTADSLKSSLRAIADALDNPQGNTWMVI